MFSIQSLKQAAMAVVPGSLAHAIRMARVDEPLLPLIERHAKGRTFVDIGANVGAYTHRLRKSARRVVAFEPVASLAEALRCRYPDVEVHACALSDRSGNAVLHIPSQAGAEVLPRASLNADANPEHESNPVLVALKRLDDFAIRDAAVIKIDVEGHEEAVLHGSVETIRRTRPVLVVEIEERHHPGRSVDIMRWVEALGYGAFFHDGKGLVSASEADFARWQSPSTRKAAFGRKSGAYVNNFVFLHTGAH